NHHRAATAGSVASGHRVGVALHDAYVLQRDAERLRDDLAIDRCMALAARLRADEHGDKAVGVDIDPSLLPGTEASRFEAIGDADAAQAAASGGGAAACRKALPRRKRERIGHVAFEIAAVIDDVSDRPMRHVRCGDEIALA